MEAIKRAFYTIGAESSGNRMFNHCLASAGVYGDPSLGHNLEDLNFSETPDLITLSRSVPHGEIIPEPKSEAKLLIDAGYEVIPIHIYRKTDFIVASQIKEGHAASTEQALRSIELAARIAYDFAKWLDHSLTTVIYELFVNHKEVRDDLFAQLGLSMPNYPLYNANEKYTLYNPPFSF